MRGEALHVVVRVDRRADDVAVGPTVGGHLGVLLHHDRGQVGGQQGGDQPGDEEHVDDIEPADELCPRELAAEQEERREGPATGTPSRTPSAIRMPVPDSWSSGSE